MARSRAPRLPAGRPRVTVLATGGTIAGAGKSRPARGYRSGVFSIEALVRAAPGIERLAVLSLRRVASIGSQDMGEAVWRELAVQAQAALSRPGTAGVVVTHGT